MVRMVSADVRLRALPFTPASANGSTERCERTHTHARARLPATRNEGVLGSSPSVGSSRGPHAFPGTHPFGGSHKGLMLPTFGCMPGRFQYELSRHETGGLWTAVALRADGVEVWAGSGYLSRLTAKIAARRGVAAYRRTGTILADAQRVTEQNGSAPRSHGSTTASNQLPTRITAPSSESPFSLPT